MAIDNSQCQCDGHRRVDSISAALKSLKPGLRSQWVHCRHHPALPFRHVGLIEKRKICRHKNSN
jgi:hypothetical protein